MQMIDLSRVNKNKNILYLEDSDYIWKLSNRIHLIRIFSFKIRNILSVHPMWYQSLYYSFRKKKKIPFELQFILKRLEVTRQIVKELTQIYLAKKIAFVTFPHAISSKPPNTY